jgi:RHS repeat-associated protein
LARIDAAVPVTRKTSYDANGNTLTDASGKSYTWDFNNRLVSAMVPGTGTVTFKYDPWGKRIQKSSTSGTTNYIYEGQWENVIEEVDNTGNILARYDQETGIDFPLSEFRSGAASYYEQDGVNSVSSLSNPAGALASTYTYDSFGKLTASTGTLVNPFQYTAREFDSETGIYEYRHPYYDQNLGRFLSEDPIAFSGRNGNIYAYVSGDPINFNDPSGLFPIFGNWCGPNWTGGQHEPYIPSHGDIPGYYKPPIDYVDEVCSYHDICYANCRNSHPCNKGARRHCMRHCDHILVHQMSTNARSIFNPFGVVVGLAIGLDFWPPAGRNGDAERDGPACCD